ncbi:MAG: MerR family transcriptional regulator [Gemmatimonadota bacterium]
MTSIGGGKDAARGRHPIRVVTQRTGLTAALLRAWERRYGAVEPGRSKGGQRLYSDLDVKRLLLLRQVVDAGRSISHVANLPATELEELVGEDRRARADLGVWQDGGVAVRDGTAGGSDEIATYLNATERAIEDLDVGSLESTLYRAALHLTPAFLLDEVLVPLLRKVGERWREGTLGPASEHLATGGVRRFLEWFINARSGTGGPLLLVGTPTGQVHELGALLAGASAASVGWRAVSLGPDLPGNEIARAVRRTGAAGVALSAVLMGGQEESLVDEIGVVVEGVGPDGFVLVGGEAARSLRERVEAMGAVYLPSLAALRGWLAARSVSG